MPRTPRKRVCIFKCAGSHLQGEREAASGYTTHEDRQDNNAQSQLGDVHRRSHCIQDDAATC